MEYTLDTNYYSKVELLQSIVVDDDDDDELKMIDLTIVAVAVAAVAVVGKLIVDFVMLMTDVESIDDLN